MASLFDFSQAISKLNKEKKFAETLKYFKDGKNEIVGSDVDLAKEIGKALGVKVNIQAMDFNNVLASVTSGKADIAISGISSDPDRAKAYDFSDSYYTANNVIVVKKEHQDKFATIADFISPCASITKS